MFDWIVGVIEPDLKHFNHVQKMSRGSFKIFIYKMLLEIKYLIYLYKHIK